MWGSGIAAAFKSKVSQAVADSPSVIATSDGGQDERSELTQCEVSGSFQSLQRVLPKERGTEWELSARTTSRE